MMNTLEIEEVARKDPCLRKFFLGVFASDKLPATIHHRPACLIANTDPAHMSGQHWVAIYFGATCEYFDSYGLPPIGPAMIYPITSYNPYCLQDLDTNVCGEYCVYFLMKRVQGHTMDSIINYLRSRRESNDSIVKTYIRRLKDSTIPRQIYQSCVRRCEYCPV